MRVRVNGVATGPAERTTKFFGGFSHFVPKLVARICFTTLCFPVGARHECASFPLCCVARVWHGAESRSGWPVNAETASSVNTAVTHMQLRKSTQQMALHVVRALQVHARVTLFFLSKLPGSHLDER